MNSGIECRKTQNFQLGGPEKLIGADDPRHALQDNGGTADSLYIDDGDILCHPLLILPYLQAFDAADAPNWCQANPQKTEVIYVGDFDTAPLEWKISDARLLASVSMETSHWELLWDRSATFWQKRKSIEQCTNASSSAGTRRRNLPSERVWESAASITSCEFTATRPFRNNEPLKFTTR